MIGSDPRRASMTRAGMDADGGVIFGAREHAMPLTYSQKLLKTAIEFSDTAIDGMRFTAYEWETQTACRVLLRLDDGSEVDIDCDKVTRCYRVWCDGLEKGDPGMN